VFPLVLNLSGRTALVVGGGAVGRRKARALLGAGGSVRLVCLEPRPAEEDHSALEWRTAAYRLEHLEGVALVVAAATAEVNRQVVADARERGLWVNSATEPDSGDFHLPAVVRCGPLTVAVSTQGTAPGLASAVRLLLQEQLDEVFARWAELVAELRPLVKAAVPDPARRREALRRLCRPDWLERLRREELAQVREQMLRASLAT
jgi:precorrin-2 dehydrogenase/sirohydrochlorin ferrochelatase